MRTIAYALLAALALVPIATADYYEGKPDCPPEMFCTTPFEDDVVQPPEGEAGITSDDASQKASGLLALGTLGALGVALLRRR